MLAKPRLPGRGGQNWAAAPRSPSAKLRSRRHAITRHAPARTRKQAPRVGPLRSQRTPAEGDASLLRLRTALRSATSRQSPLSRRNTRCRLPGRRNSIQSNDLRLLSPKIAPATEVDFATKFDLATKIHANDRKPLRFPRVATSDSTTPSPPTSYDLSRHIPLRRQIRDEAPQQTVRRQTETARLNESPKENDPEDSHPRGRQQDSQITVKWARQDSNKRHFTG